MKLARKVGIYRSTSSPLGRCEQWNVGGSITTVSVLCVPDHVRIRRVEEEGTVGTARWGAALRASPGPAVVGDALVCVCCFGEVGMFACPFGHAGIRNFAFGMQTLFSSGPTTICLFGARPCELRTANKTAIGPPCFKRSLVKRPLDLC